jgi:hypothetical protein
MTIVIQSGYKTLKIMNFEFSILAQGQDQKFKITPWGKNNSAKPMGTLFGRGGAKNRILSPGDLAALRYIQWVSPRISAIRFS